MVESNYSKELAAWIKKETANRRRLDATVVTFLAVREDVKTAMNLGYTVTTIYDHMRATNRINCSYNTFRKHVLRYIKTTPFLSTPTPRTTLNDKNHLKTVKHQPKTISSTTEPTLAAKKVHGFTFDPNPKKEDLF